MSKWVMARKVAAHLSNLASLIRVLTLLPVLRRFFYGQPKSFYAALADDRVGAETVVSPGFSGDWTNDGMIAPTDVLPAAVNPSLQQKLDTVSKTRRHNDLSEIHWIPPANFESPYDVAAAHVQKK